VLLGACSFFVPDSKTPSDRAHAAESKCGAAPRDAVGDPTSPAVVERVEPSYARVLGGPNAAEARLRGARVHLRPLPGATAEALTRALECHEADVALGLAKGPDDDPYVLPGRWLTIDVRSERDGFVAVVETDDLADARLVYARALRFAGARSTSGEPLRTLGQ
jgi:hypothetical protein